MITITTVIGSSIAFASYLECGTLRHCALVLQKHSYVASACVPIIPGGYASLLKASLNATPLSRISEIRIVPFLGIYLGPSNTNHPSISFHVSSSSADIV